jgi:DNA polymerase I
MAVLLLDTYGLFFRAYHALPRMTTSQGKPTSAVYGLLSVLLKMMREHRPSAFAFAVDAPGPTFRHRAFEQYKAQRSAVPDDLSRQFEALGELIDALGVPAFQATGFEADDVLATLARELSQAGHEVLIATGDRDLLQLVSERVRVLFLGHRGGPTRLYDRLAVVARFGIEPQLLPVYSALLGDVSDNIPKIPGIGTQTARELVAQYGSVAAILERLPEVGNARVRAALQAHRAALVRNEALTRLRDDVELPAGARVAPVSEAGFARTRELLLSLEFHSLLARLDALRPPFAGA